MRKPSFLWPVRALLGLICLTAFGVLPLLAEPSAPAEIHFQALLARLNADRPAVSLLNKRLQEAHVRAALEDTHRLRGELG